MPENVTNQNDYELVFRMHQLMEKYQYAKPAVSLARITETLDTREETDVANVDFLTKFHRRDNVFSYREFAGDGHEKVLTISGPWVGKDSSGRETRSLELTLAQSYNDSSELFDDKTIPVGSYTLSADGTVRQGHQINAPDEPAGSTVTGPELQAIADRLGAALQGLEYHNLYAESDVAKSISVPPEKMPLEKKGEETSFPGTGTILLGTLVAAGAVGALYKRLTRQGD